MTDHTPDPEKQEAFAAALPDNPTADHAQGNCAMPQTLSKELGDYAEGDYDVACATRSAPSEDESDFTRVIKDGL
ncbi:MAG: hypothetical protein AAF311_02155 [Pseudomonadota bacterium]